MLTWEHTKAIIQSLLKANFSIQLILDYERVVPNFKDIADFFEIFQLLYNLTLVIHHKAVLVFLIEL